jgi:hypothetical protein
MIDAKTIDCWRVNYGLDKRSPEDAHRWWNENFSGLAPSGAVAALGLCLIEIERLRAELQDVKIRRPTQAITGYNSSPAQGRRARQKGRRGPSRSAGDLG